MGSLVYASKAAATPAVTTPPDWPDGWDWPDPWDDGPDSYPPGWPVNSNEPDYNLEVTLPDYVGESSITVECETQTDLGASTSDWDQWILNVKATSGLDTVQIRLDAGDSWSNSLNFDINNYSGSKYGISESILFNMSEYYGETINVTCTLLAVTPDLIGIGSMTGQVNAKILSASFPSSLIDRSYTRFVVRTTDLDDVNTSAFNGQNMILEFFDVDTGDALNCKKQYGDAWSTSLSYVISDISSKYTGVIGGVEAFVHVDTTAYTVSVDYIGVRFYYEDYPTVTGPLPESAAKRLLSASDHSLELTAGPPSDYKRGDNFTLTITAKGYIFYAGDPWDITTSASVDVSFDDPLDVIYDNGVPMTSITLTNGVFTTTTASISGGSGCSETGSFTVTTSGDPIIDAVVTPASTGSFNIKDIVSATLYMTSTGNLGSFGGGIVYCSAALSEREISASPFTDWAEETVTYNNRPDAISGATTSSLEVGGTATEGSVSEGDMEPLLRWLRDNRPSATVATILFYNNTAASIAYNREFYSKETAPTDVKKPRLVVDGTTLYPVDDAVVRDDNPNTSYPTSRLQVTSSYTDPNVNEFNYILFDISSVLP